MKTYTILLRTHKENWIPKFSFNAKTGSEADYKAFCWAHRQGYSQDDVTFRIATENEAANWLHNEYIH